MPCVAVHVRLHKKESPKYENIIAFSQSRRQREKTKMRALTHPSRHSRSQTLGCPSHLFSHHHPCFASICPGQKSTYPILKSNSDRKPDLTCVKQSYRTSARHKRLSCIFQRNIARSNHDTRRRAESWVKMWLGERGPRRIGMP
jgi:hypothetical protein